MIACLPSNAFSSSPPVYSASVTSFLESDSSTEAKDAIGLAEVQPLIVAFKNVTVLTTGAPADVATVTLPSWCTRYTVILTGSRCVAETAAGTLAAGSFIIRDAASGGGNVLSSSFSGPASTSVSVSVTGTPVSSPPITAQTLFLSQTANSANSGRISVYAVILPLL